MAYALVANYPEVNSSATQFFNCWWVCLYDSERIFQQANDKVSLGQKNWHMLLAVCHARHSIYLRNSYRPGT